MLIYSESTISTDSLTNIDQPYDSLSMEAKPLATCLQNLFNYLTEKKSILVCSVTKFFSSIEVKRGNQIYSFEIRGSKMPMVFLYRTFLWNPDNGFHVLITYISSTDKSCMLLHYNYSGLKQ